MCRFTPYSIPCCVCQSCFYYKTVLVFLCWTLQTVASQSVITTTRYPWSREACVVCCPLPVVAAGRAPRDCARPCFRPAHWAAGQSTGGSGRSYCATIVAGRARQRAGNAPAARYTPSVSCVPFCLRHSCHT